MTYSAQSKVEERDDNLARVDYLPILKAISEVLKGSKKTKKLSAFLLDKDERLMLLAERVTTSVIALCNQKPDDFPPPLRGSTKFASVNFADESLFREYIRKIQKELKSQLDEIFQINQDNPESLQKWQAHFLSTFKNFVESPGFFKFSIEQERQLKLQKINTDNVKANESAQKHFRGKIRIQIPIEFDQQLLEAINNELNRENGFYSSCDKNEIEELNDLYENIYRDGDSRINNLKKLIQEEITGKIRADISLEFMQIFVDRIPNSKKKEEGYQLLVDFLNRLKEFDDFLSRDIHTVSLFGNNYNLQDLFGRADKWDLLPVKVKIEARQGEGLDETREWHEFTYAIDFKLNGRVPLTNSKSVFEHNCKLLNPESEEGYKSEIKKCGNDKKRKAGFYGKLVKIIFLYCFVFYEFNSKESREKVVERIFQRLSPSTTEGEQINFLNNFSNYLESQSKAEIKSGKIVSYIKDICSEKNAAWPTIPINGYLSLRKGLLKHPTEIKKILDNESFLTDELSQDREGISFKSALQFMKFVRDRDEDNLYEIPVKVEIDDIRYKFEGEAEKGKFNLVNDEEFRHLLVMFVERTELLKLWVTEDVKRIQKLQPEQLQKMMPNLTLEASKKVISGEQKIDIKQIKPRQSLTNYPKSVVVTYDNSIKFTNLDDSEIQSVEDRNRESFYYQIVYSIIVILGLWVLYETLSITKATQKETIKTFISLFRSQSSSKDNSTSFDTFIATLCKDLELILDTVPSILCSTQGLDTSSQNQNKYKKNNALFSLYSKLPSQIKLDREIDFLKKSKIDKVAMIAVSSYECDAQHQGDQKKSIVFGRVYTINRKDKLFEVKSFGSFCKSEFSNKRFASSIVVDQVSRLDQAGYKHIFYVSKTPYQDKFNFSLRDEEKDDDTERLFFMNSQIIRQMKAVNNSITIYPVFVSNYRIFDLKRGNKDKGYSYYLASVEDVGKIEPLTRNAAAFLNLYNLEAVDQNNSSYNSVISYACPINLYATDVLDNREIIQGLFGKDTNTSDRDTLFLFMVMLHYSRNEKFGNFSTIKLNPYEDIFEEVGYKSAKFYHPESLARFNLLAFVYEVFNSAVG